VVALKGFQVGLDSSDELVDALHFHRCVKDLAYARGKICSARRAGEDPSVHMPFDERPLVLRREQSED
jgi:hypothetical protein